LKYDDTSQRITFINFDHIIDTFAIYLFILKNFEIKEFNKIKSNIHVLLDKYYKESFKKYNLLDYSYNVREIDEILENLYKTKKEEIIDNLHVKKNPNSYWDTFYRLNQEDKIKIIEHYFIEIKESFISMCKLIPLIFILKFKYLSNFIGFEIDFANELYNIINYKSPRSTPNSRWGGFYNKYLKYKQKYLALKRLNLSYH